MFCSVMCFQLVIMFLNAAWGRLDTVIGWGQMWAGHAEDEGIIRLESVEVRLYPGDTLTITDISHIRPLIREEPITSASRKQSNLQSTSDGQRANVSSDHSMDPPPQQKKQTNKQKKPFGRSVKADPGSATPQCTLTQAVSPPQLVQLIQSS